MSIIDLVHLRWTGGAQSQLIWNYIYISFVHGVDLIGYWFDWKKKNNAKVGPEIPKGLSEFQRGLRNIDFSRIFIQKNEVSWLLVRNSNYIPLSYGLKLFNIFLGATITSWFWIML